MFKPQTILLVIIVFFLSACTIKNPEISNKPHVIINNKIIQIEIADEQPEQIQGLSDRESLDKNSGMLFIFNDKQIRSFWMKNMHFPLDIIWIQDNKIVNISKNLPPEGEMPENHYSSKYPVNYVLEVNAGLVDEYEIKIGDIVEFHY